MILSSLPARSRHLASLALVLASSRREGGLVATNAVMFLSHTPIRARVMVGLLSPLLRRCLGLCSVLLQDLIAHNIKCLLVRSMQVYLWHSILVKLALFCCLQCFGEV